MLLLNLSLTALVVSSPRDMAVANGTWASFECRISCTHVFYWFVGSGRYRRLTDVDVNGFMQRNGIIVDISNSNECTDNGDYTQQLRILATLEVNGTAVQCAAVPRRPTPNGVFFSSYAVLMVEPIGEHQLLLSLFLEGSLVCKLKFSISMSACETTSRHTIVCTMTSATLLRA